MYMTFLGYQAGGICIIIALFHVKRPKQNHIISV